MSRTPPLAYWAYVSNRVGPENWFKFKAFSPQKDYVGAENSKFKPPQTIYGINMRPAAFVHDELFRIGGGETEFDEANKAFLDCMLWLIDSHDYWWGFGWIKTLATYRAMTYFNAVNIGGREHFNWTKK